MTEQELEALLIERAHTLDLKKLAFETLDRIYSDKSIDNDSLGGFRQDEIIAKFDTFEFRIDRRDGGPIIRTMIGLYVEAQNGNDNLESIGYFELDTDLNGEVLDDWFVIEKEKYLKDIGIVSFFQIMNEKLPIEYLKRNHLQYELVSYVSMVGTLFLSKHFEGAGRFILRANQNIETVGKTKFDTAYLKEVKRFLKITRGYLVNNNLVSTHLKQELIENENSG